MLNITESEKWKSKPQWYPILYLSERLSSKRQEIIKCWRGCEEKESFCTVRNESKLVQSLWKIVWSFLKKIKKRTTICSSNSTSEKYENTDLIGYMHPHVHCSIIYNSQDMEATKLTISGWMDREYVVYVYIRILFGQRKWNLAICNITDGPWGHHAEWNRREKDKQHMTSLFSGI